MRLPFKLSPKGLASTRPMTNLMRAMPAISYGRRERRCHAETVRYPTRPGLLAEIFRRQAEQASQTTNTALEQDTSAARHKDLTHCWNRANRRPCYPAFLGDSNEDTSQASLAHHWRPKSAPSVSQQGHLMNCAAEHPFRLWQHKTGRGSPNSGRRTRVS